MSDTGISKSIKTVYADLAKKMEGMLKAQAPSNKIASSIRVGVDQNGLFIELLPIDGKPNYGKYLHSGTGLEREGPNSSDFGVIYEALFGRTWTPNPGRGKGGIKPRYFLNLSDVTWEQFNDTIAREFALSQTEFISNLITSKI